MKKRIYIFLSLCSTFSIIHSAAGPQMVVNNEKLSVIDYSQEVAQQSEDEGTCGLHAAKNSIALYKFASGTLTSQQLTEALNKEANTCPHDGSFSDNVYTQATHSGFARDKISVLEQPGNLDFMPVEEAEKLANVANELLQQKDVFHAFALGKKGQHYIGAVLSRKNGEKPIFYIADSLKKNVNDPTNIKLITTDLHPLLIQGPYHIRTNIINNLMQSAERNMLHTPKAALQNVVEIIQYAQKYKLLQNSRFIDDYQKRLISVLEEIEPFLFNHEHAVALYTINFLNREPTQRGSWNPPQPKETSQHIIEEEQSARETALQLQQERILRQQQQAAQTKAPEPAKPIKPAPAPKAAPVKPQPKPPKPTPKKVPEPAKPIKPTPAPKAAPVKPQPKPSKPAPKKAPEPTKPIKPTPAPKAAPVKPQPKPQKPAPKEAEIKSMTATEFGKLIAEFHNKKPLSPAQRRYLEGIANPEKSTGSRERTAYNLLQKAS